MELEAIKNKLNQSHFRLTQEREAVLLAFMESGQMLTPAKLHETVKEKYSRVGLTTVYRLLEVLTKLEMATPFLINGEIFYTFCSESHHHHFVCLECHRVQDIYECSAVPQHRRDLGTVDYHRMDLYGHCTECDKGDAYAQSLES